MTGRAAVFGALALTLARVPGPVWGQAPAPRDSAANEQVVTLGALTVVVRADSGASAATSYELDRRRLDALDVRNASDALRSVPGLYPYRTARNEVAFRLRGFEQRQVSVFLDGVPISLPYDGLLDIGQLAGANIERVQVSEGFASLLYGANALGGSVNLVTTLPRAERAATVRLERSDQRRTLAAAEATGGLGRLRLSGSASMDQASSFRLSRDFTPGRNEDGGDRDNSAFARKQYGVKAQYVINGSHQLGVNVAGVDNSYDVPPDISTSSPRYWRFPIWRKQLVALTSRHAFGSWGALRTAWYQDAYRNRLRSFDDATYTTQTRRYAFDSDYDDESRGVNLYPSVSLLPFGATSGVLSLKRDVHRERSGNDPYARYATDLFTLGVEQDLRREGPWSASAGAGVSRLRPRDADGWPLPPPILQANAQLVVRYQLTPFLAAHAALSRKSRFPTLKELYSSRMAENVPNPQLRPETSVHSELGLRAGGGGWIASAAIYASSLRDVINNAVVSPGVRQMRNVDRARLSGAEAELRYETAAGQLGIEYGYLRAENRSPDRDTDYLEYRPAHRVTGLLERHLHRYLRAGAELTYTSAQHYQDADSGAWAELAGVWLAAARVEVPLRERMHWYLRADNVLDASYFGQHGMPMPGRELSAGFKLALR